VATLTSQKTAGASVMAVTSQRDLRHPRVSVTRYVPVSRFPPRISLKSGRKTLSSCRSALLKPAPGLNGPPAAPANQLQRHHDPPLSKGGNSQSPKNRIVCKDCHIKIHKNPLNP
jgi:hypothetical protein